MKKETLEEAKAIEKQIDACNALLVSTRDTYYWCLVTVECGNSNSAPEHYGNLPREIWTKMLEALRIERDRLEEKLAEL